MEEFSRTELLIKKEGIETLQSSTVAVFGVGGTVPSMETMTARNDLI